MCLIHGPRGSGKTFLLLSILRWLKLTAEGLRSAMTEKNSEKDGIDATQLLFSDDFPRPIVLKAIFPADTEAAGTVMDGIFAQMNAVIKEKLDERGLDDQRVRELKDLQANLRTKIAASWTFDRNLGGEALLNDAADFEDYSSKRAVKAWEGIHRIQTWRDFVQDFLKKIRSHLLVIGIDDTDIRPKLTTDTLESLRLYLDHPQIVTIIAGNVSAMRKALAVNSFSEMSQAISSIGKENPTAQFWRRSQRRENELYLEKVLPPENRFNIGSFNERVDVGRLDSDFSIFLRNVGRQSGDGIKTFDDFCRERMQDYRDSYLTAKAKAARQLIEQGNDLAGLGSPFELTTSDFRDLENYVSWWQLRHHYASALRPTDARQLSAFLHFFGRKGVSNKRLVVFLFQSANNAHLLHLMYDNDYHVLDWLRTQKIASFWTGQRRIEINGTPVPYASYGYEIICYRIDVAMSLPLRYVVDSKIPRALLPTAWGKDSSPYLKNIGDWRLSTYVVGAIINHASIPRNCRFMSDLRVLPDVCFAEFEEANNKNDDNDDFKAKSELRKLRHFFSLDKKTDDALKHIEKLSGDDEGVFWELVNDLRRAWAATLIFDYGNLNEILVVTKSGSQDLRVSRAPSALSSQRYRFLTIEAFEQSIKVPLKRICEEGLDPWAKNFEEIKKLRQARHLLFYIAAVSDCLATIFSLSFDGAQSAVSDDAINRIMALLGDIEEFLNKVEKAQAQIWIYSLHRLWETDHRSGPRHYPSVLRKLIEEDSLMLSSKEGAPLAFTPDASFITMLGAGNVKSPETSDQTDSLQESDLSGVVFDLKKNLNEFRKFVQGSLIQR